MAGKEFNIQPLNVLLDDFNGQQIQELLDEALDSHIVEEVVGSIDRFQFSHALIQETLYQELSTRRKVLLTTRQDGYYCGLRSAAGGIRSMRSGDSPAAAGLGRMRPADSSPIRKLEGDRT